MSKHRSKPEVTRKRSKSCIVRVRELWKHFLRKVLHVGFGKNKNSKTSSSSTIKNSEITPIPPPLPLTKSVISCFVAKEYPSSVSLAEESDWNSHLLEDIRSEYADSRRGPWLLELPMQVRGNIYNRIGPEDVLSLRLTSRALKNDVESNHGVVLRIHDGRLDYEKPLETLGIEKLIVEHFLQEEHVYTDFFPLPHLLKTVVISGPISKRNLRFLLQIAANLTKLIFNFHLPDDQLLQNFELKRCAVSSLKLLEIYSDSFRGTDEDQVLLLKSIHCILENIICPTLTSFIFGASNFFEEKADEYHRLVSAFIIKNRKSLKRIRVQLMQLMAPNLGHLRANTTENVDWVEEQLSREGESSDGFMLEDVRIKLNSRSEYWHPLVNTQNSLQTLHLDAVGQAWNSLAMTLNNCSGGLRNIMVTGVAPSIIDNGIRTLPVDLGLLQKFKRLENIEIQCEEMESRGLPSASVAGTSLLPQTLKSVKLCHLKLKPYQALFLFLKLPNLMDIALNFWSDGEATLAAFIGVLTFLIKFDQSPVMRIEMTDHRRKMENQQESIIRMRNVLQHHTDILQSSSELYSTLRINRRFKKTWQLFG